MKVFVTGGTGFTGSQLVLRLLDQGHEVHTLDVAKGLFYDELKERGAKITLGSVTDEKLVRELCDACEVVHHVAAAFRKLNQSKRFYWDVNVEGTRNVAKAALSANVRKFIYCSTCGVHGHVKNPPAGESSPIAPEDYYQYTKYEGERAVLDLVEKGLDAVILRPAAIYGPGDPERFVMLFRRVKRGHFPMFGDGSTLYHPLHIDNLLDAFDLAVAADGRAGESYLIADADYWSLNELVQRVAASMELPVSIRHFPYWPVYAAACMCEVVCKPFRLTPPLFRRRVNWFRQDRAFSIEKAIKHLGYAPKVGLDDGLRQTAQWYNANGYI